MASLLLALMKIPFYYLLEIIFFVTRCRPKKQLKNEHILLTGAAQGIGGGLADKLAAMGNTIHCVDIDSALVTKKVDELRARGYKAHAYTCDLTNKDGVQKLYDEVTGTGHTITMLINNAGIAPGISVTDQTLDQLDKSMTLNLTSNLWLIKLFLPKMLAMNRGHVVNMASLAGIVPARKCTDYCAAKRASIQTMNQLRTEYVKTNLKFTAICPTFVRTRMTARLENVRSLLPLDVCIESCIRGILEEREVVIIPNKARAYLLIRGLIPISLRKHMGIPK